MYTDKIEIATVFGIPVMIDITAILLAILYGFAYFTSGDVNDVSYGLLLVAGVALSILAHEFGHAAAGSYYRVRTTHVELNGCGGLCHFATHLPPDRMANIVVLLAGPAVTLAIWLMCEGIAVSIIDWPERVGYITGTDRLYGLIWHIGYINYWLLLFNLLPSHPLDGGRALAHVLSRWIGYDRGMRTVAYTGLLVIAWLLYQGLEGATFAFVIAFYLFQHNQLVFATHGGGPRWTRWN